MRAAKGFQILANEGSFFFVDCRFRKVVTSASDGIDHIFWAKGAEEFKTYFGYAANYFAGALEYMRLATGWGYPYRSLEVTLLRGRKSRKTSSGFALCPGLRGAKIGEIRIFWEDGEFTLTVLHELVHLFKNAWLKARFNMDIKAEEDWVEQQALKLTMGL